MNSITKKVLFAILFLSLMIASIYFYPSTVSYHKERYVDDEKNPLFYENSTPAYHDVQDTGNYVSTYLVFIGIFSLVGFVVCIIFIIVDWMTGYYDNDEDDDEPEHEQSSHHFDINSEEE